MVTEVTVYQTNGSISFNAKHGADGGVTSGPQANPNTDYGIFSYQNISDVADVVATVFDEIMRGAAAIGSGNPAWLKFLQSGPMSTATFSVQTVDAIINSSDRHEMVRSLADIMGKQLYGWAGATVGAGGAILYTGFTPLAVVGVPAGGILGYFAGQDLYTMSPAPGELSPQQRIFEFVDSFWANPNGHVQPKTVFANTLEQAPTATYTATKGVILEQMAREAGYLNPDGTPDIHGWLNSDPSNAYLNNRSIISGDDQYFLTKPDDYLTPPNTAQPYLLEQIFDSLSSAAESVAQFISDQVGIGTEWYTNVDGQTMIAAWLAQNMQDILDNELTADEALISLAKFAGEQVLANFSGALIITKLDAQDALEDVFKFLGADEAHASQYVAGVQAALGRMVVELITTDFDVEQATNAGVAILSASVTATFLDQKGWLESGTPGSAAASAAAATAIIGIINSGDFDSADWGQLGVQVGVAAAAGYGGVAIASLINSGVTIIGVDPVTIVASAVISLVLGKLLGGLFGGGKKFGPGEFETLEQLKNSIYQVQTINVNGELVPALVAVHPQGATVMVAGSGIGYVLGNVGADVLVGTDAVQTIDGKGGADYLEGRGGNDNLLGGDANDHLNGGDGNDILQGDAGDDIIFGEADNDTVVAGAGDDFAQLGSGDDIAAGGTGRDYILAGGGEDAVSGDADNDMVDGGYGSDSLDGGAGDDLILGNLGNDFINGGAGADTIFGDEDNDQIYGGDANDYIDGGDDSDMLYGENGNDMVIGGDGDDFADGGLGNDNLFGGVGNDVLLGGMDDDYMNGEDGDDSIEGGFGNDILIGGAGANQLTGGDGNDTYMISADLLEHDNTITDSAGTDTMLLSWLSDTNAQSGLELEQDGDDLSVSYNGRVLATIANQFVAGQSLERIELAGGNYINLSAVSYDSTTHLGDFSAAMATGATAASQVAAREYEIEDTFTSQGDYWNASFLTKLSQVAYDEQLSDSTTYRYYDGLEVDQFFRNRGKFGGKYSVYKLSQPGNLVGSEYSQEYVIQDSGQQSAALAFGNTVAFMNAPYDSLINGATVIYSAYGGKNFQDIVVNGTVVSTRIASDANHYAPGATLFGASFALRSSIGTHSTTDVAIKTYGGDQLVGAYWNETLDGKSGDDVLIGNDGNDSVVGGDGADWLFGGDGNDTVVGGTGDDIAFGGDGNDSVSGGDGSDAILGSGGNDTLNGDAGDDWIDGGAENDSISGGDGNDVVLASDGNDTVVGGNGNDVLQGEAGDDWLQGNAGDDTLFGGDGIDVLNGGDGADLLNDEDGIDRADYAGSTAAVNINLATNVNTGGSAQGDLLYNIEQVFGSSYNDTITGSARAEYLNGFAGNDSLSGGDGRDILFGADGTNGAAGSDILDGGADSDVATYEAATSAINLNLTTGTHGGQALGDTLISIETIIASAYNDTITGDASGSVFYGLAGNDTLSGMDGDDTLLGGVGADSLNGGNGADFVNYTGSSTATTVYLGYWGGVAATAYATGGDATGDIFSSIENIYGSIFADIYVGTAGANNIHGYDGNDNIAGMGGADTLDGGAGIDVASFLTVSSAVGINLSTNTHTGFATGMSLLNFEQVAGSAYNDTIIGSISNDTLNGYAGNDSISGGDGDDYFMGSAGGDTLNGGNGMVDMVDYSPSTTAVSLNFTTNTYSGGDAAGDNLTSIEAIIATAYNDSIVGDAANNFLYGLGGNDSIFAGDGDDYLGSGLGADTLNGGNGFDYVNYNSSTVAVSVNLATNVVSGGDAAGDVISNIEGVFGSGAGNDTLTGNTVFNALFGYGGNDSLIGGAGADYLDGGDGLDTVSYASAGGAVSVSLAGLANTGSDAQGDTILNVETVIGSAYADIIAGDAAANNLLGGDGNDILTGGAGADTLQGGNGSADYVIYTGSAAAVNVNLALATAQSGGEAQGDILSSIEGVWGSAYGDVLMGIADNNALFGYDGNDTLYGDLGADYLDGGAGLDYILYSSSTAAVSVNLTTNVNTGGSAQGDAIYGVEVVFGSNYADTLVGAATADYLYGGAGNDNISAMDGGGIMGGGAGADTLTGGNGFDYANYDGSAVGVNVNLATGIGLGGDAQGDILINIEALIGSNLNRDTLIGNNIANMLQGQSGNDILIGAGGNDTLDGGAGVDTADYQNSTSAVAVNLLTNTHGGDATGDSFVSIEDVWGSAYDDTIIGNGAANSLWGNAGADLINGGDGNDTILSGLGADTVDGGADWDMFSYANSATAVNIDLGTGSFTGGDAAGDVFSNIETFAGSAFNDTMTGGTANDYLHGLDGADSMNGGDGNDTLIGGAGADTLNGGNGFDMVDYSASGVGLIIKPVYAIAYYGDAQGDVLQSIEGIRGTAYLDEITTASGNDSIEGMGGNDIIDGGTGNDTIVGGEGDDYFMFRNNYGQDRVINFDGAGVTGGDRIAFYDTATATGTKLTYTPDFVSKITYDFSTGTAMIALDGQTTIAVTGVYTQFIASDFNFYT